MKRGIPFTVIRYITAEYAKTLALTLVIVTGLWVFVSAMQVVRHNILGPVQFLTIVPLLAVISLAYTLPMAILFGASVSYGRMSSENEVRAMEWNGIHIGWILLPAIVIAVGASVLAIYLNGNVVPNAKANRDDLLQTNFIESTNRKLTKASQSGESMGFGRLSIALKSYDPDTMTLGGVTVVQIDAGKDAGKVLRRVDARSAKICPGRQPGAVAIGVDQNKPENKRFYVTFVFGDGWLMEFDQNGVMKARGVAPPVAVDISENVKQGDPDRMPFFEALRFARTTDKPADRAMAWTSLYQRLALGTSPFFFALLAVPMAVIAKWKHMLTSFLPSLLVVMVVYYPLLMWAKVQGEAGRVDPMFGMFMANAVIFVIGTGLVVRLLRR